jgi:hypothetical protein
VAPSSSGVEPSAQRIDVDENRKLREVALEALEKGKPVVTVVGDKLVKAIPIAGAVYTYYSTEGSTGWKLLNVVAGEIGAGPFDLQTIGEGLAFLASEAVDAIQDPERAKKAVQEMSPQEIERVRNPWAAAASSQKL